jgi:N-acetylglutamate synthase-like GNAT family acetyltransferase
MIRCCEDRDFEEIWDIVNDGAGAYKGVIPEDCWKEPYMSREELRHEMRDGVMFWGYEQHGHLAGVMGLQSVKDVVLIRHAYIRTQAQKHGIGGQLLLHLRLLAHAPVLVGTWAAASWAIHFYEKHGFRVVDAEEKVRLLETYWNVPRRQVETSVVLEEQVNASRQAAYSRL